MAGAVRTRRRTHGPAADARGAGGLAVAPTGARALHLAAVLALAGVLGGGTTAGAVIVPQHGMGGVRLGQTEDKVRAVLGPPVRAVDRRNAFGRVRELRYRGLTVTLQGGRRVSAISTGARRERTRGGIGVGSREADVRRAMPAARCSTSFGLRACVIGRLRPGRTVTLFAIRSGAVARVTVGHVID